MIEDVIRLWPIMCALVVYFVRLEVSLAKMKTDICWIKKHLEVSET